MKPLTPAAPSWRHVARLLGVNTLLFLACRSHFPPWLGVFDASHDLDHLWPLIEVPEANATHPAVSRSLSAIGKSSCACRDNICIVENVCVKHAQVRAFNLLSGDTGHHVVHTLLLSSEKHVWSCQHDRPYDRVP